MAFPNAVYRSRKHLFAEMLPGGGRHPRRPAPADGVGQVASIDVPILVEHPEAHHMKSERHCPVLFDLRQPSGRDPRVRAHRVEVEVDNGRHTVHGNLATFVNLVRYWYQFSS